MSNAATCHPDRPNKGHGLCNTCYGASWRAKNPGRQWQQRHPEAARAYGKAWYAANRERIGDRKRELRAAGRYTARDRRIYLNYAYGLTPDQYRDMLVGQAGRCLICLRVPERDLVVDHDHATGKVRGLLCQHCNKGIGHFLDDPARLMAAARYVGVAA